MRTVRRLSDANPYIITPDVLDPLADTPDIIYTANWGISLPFPTAPFILSRMKSPYRRPEPAKVAAYLLASLRANLFVLPSDRIFEGTGLVTWSYGPDGEPRHIWIGYGVRTTRADAVALSRLIRHLGSTSGTCPQIHLLELKNPWYDLDLALLGLPNGNVLYRPDAFSHAAVQEIRRICGVAAIPFTISGAPFALNAKILPRRGGGSPVIICGTTTRAAMDIVARASGGLPVISCPLGEIEKGGGSVRCCMLDYYIPTNQIHE